MNDENGVPIVGAVITETTHTATSIAGGTFSLTTDTAGQNGYLALMVQKSGYAPISRRVQVTDGSGFLPAVMRSPDTATSFTMPAVGQTQELSVTHQDVSAQLVFQGNSLVNSSGQAVSGNVQVALTMWSPSEALTSAPGALRAALPDGSPGDSTPQFLRTYGMLDIQLQQNGDNLQIMAGQTANFTITTNANMRNGYANRIPAIAAPSLWTLNPNLGVWVENTGDATYDPNTGNLTGVLRHLSTINGDEPVTTTNDEGGCVRGKVVDLCNEPVQGAAVTLYLQSGLFQGTTLTVTASTDSTGTYAMLVTPSTHMGYYGEATYQNNDTNSLASIAQGYLHSSVETTNVPGDYPLYTLIPVSVITCSNPTGECVDAECACYNDVNDDTCVADTPQHGRNTCWVHPMGLDPSGTQCYYAFNMYESWTGVPTGDLCSNCWPIITMRIPIKQVANCGGGVGTTGPDPCTSIPASQQVTYGNVCSPSSGQICCPDLGANGLTCADNICVPNADAAVVE